MKTIVFLDVDVCCLAEMYYPENQCNSRSEMFVYQNTTHRVA